MDVNRLLAILVHYNLALSEPQSWENVDCMQLLYIWYIWLSTTIVASCCCKLIMAVRYHKIGHSWLKLLACWEANVDVSPSGLYERVCCCNNLDRKLWTTELSRLLQEWWKETNSSAATVHLSSAIIVKFRCLLLLQDGYGGAVPHFEKFVTLPVTPCWWISCREANVDVSTNLVDFMIESVIPQSPLNHKAAEQLTPGIVVKPISAATVVHLVWLWNFGCLILLQVGQCLSLSLLSLDTAPAGRQMLMIYSTTLNYIWAGQL